MAEILKEVKSSWITKRDILWILVFMGFAVNYMIRINLNIAIVAMVKAKVVSLESIATSSECLREARLQTFNEEQLKLAMLENNTLLEFNSTEMPYFQLFSNETSDNMSAPATLRIPSSMTTPKNLPHQEKAPEDEGFTWNEYEQGLILGAFFWLHWTTQVPGGLLAQKYGTKLIYGLSNFTGVLCCFVIPVASYWGWKALIFVRCIQGILAGFAWPAMHNMTAKWIPPNERSKFVTAYLGSSVGAALTFPMCGYIIDLMGWEYVFYISGVLGSAWFCAWWLFVFDSPAQHPSISHHERDYIHESLGHSVSKEKAPVPWRHILTSVPVWMNILAQWGGIWGLFTLMTHAPSYFKYIHGWNIRVTGLLSGMPHMLRMLFAYLFSLVGDYLLRTNKMSRTNVRKLATGFCTIGQGFCMLALAYSGCNSEAAIVFLTLATAIHGTVSSGPLASFVDISPNYASVCLGLCGMIAVLPGFISPAVVGTLTYQNNTVGQWQMVFLIAVAMLMVSGVAYLLFSRSDLEPWNTPERMIDEKLNLEAELDPLKQEKEENTVVITEKEKNITQETI